jgi:hypothetical protein
MARDSYGSIFAGDVVVVGGSVVADDSVLAAFAGGSVVPDDLVVAGSLAMTRLTVLPDRTLTPVPGSVLNTVPGG